MIAPSAPPVFAPSGRNAIGVYWTRRVQAGARSGVPDRMPHRARPTTRPSRMSRQSPKRCVTEPLHVATIRCNITFSHIGTVAHASDVQRPRIANGAASHLRGAYLHHGCLRSSRCRRHRPTRPARWPTTLIVGRRSTGIHHRRPMRRTNLMPLRAGSSPVRIDRAPAFRVARAPATAVGAGRGSRPGTWSLVPGRA